MQEVTYSSIYDQVRALAGVSDFTTQEQSLITTLVNRRSRFAYEASDFWPRWLVVGERRTYSANTVSQPFVIGYLYDFDSWQHALDYDWCCIQYNWRYICGYGGR